MSASTELISNLRSEPAATSTVVNCVTENAWVPWLMMLGDFAALELSLALGVLTRQALSSLFPNTPIFPEQYWGIAVGLVLLLPVNLVLEMYPGYSIGPVDRLRRRVYALLGIFAVLMVWDYLVGTNSWSRGVLLFTLTYSLCILPLLEALLRGALVRGGFWGRPVVVLGAGEAGTSLVKALRRQPDLGMKPLAIFDDNASTWGKSIEGVKVVGPIRMARSLSQAAEVAVIAVPNLPRLKLLEWLKSLPFARVVVIPDLSGLQTQGVRALDFSGSLGLEVKRNLMVPRNRRLKRAADYLVTLPLFVIAAPIIGILAALVKACSPGPAFYSQVRVGLHGRPIRIWKLRTMRADAEDCLQSYLDSHPEEQEQWSRFFKLKQDPRVIPLIGRFLRRSSLDELPQLFNVLKGDMSLVGPRPFPGYHLAHFPPEFRALRASVLPGLTGLWQVSERSNGDLGVQERLDTYYIRNWSLWLDGYLMVRTLSAVVSGTGAH